MEVVLWISCQPNPTPQTKPNIEMDYRKKGFPEGV
jgi:hypothetical protein